MSSEKKSKKSSKKKSTSEKEPKPSTPPEQPPSPPQQEIRQNVPAVPEDFDIANELNALIKQAEDFYDKEMEQYQ